MNFKECSCEDDLVFSLRLKDGSRQVLTRCVIKAYRYPLPVLVSWLKRGAEERANSL